MQAKLLVVSGRASRQEIPLKLPMTIGRAKTQRLAILHPTVSRRHCEIFERDGVLWVRDVGSSNGTFIGDQRITEAALTPGARLTIGPLIFEADYELANGADARTQPPAGKARTAASAKAEALTLQETVIDPFTGDLPNLGELQSVELAAELVDEALHPETAFVREDLPAPDDELGLDNRDLAADDLAPTAQGEPPRASGATSRVEPAVHSAGNPPDAVGFLLQDDMDLPLDDEGFSAAAAEPPNEADLPGDPSAEDSSLALVSLDEPSVSASDFLTAPESAAMEAAPVASPAGDPDQMSELPSTEPPQKEPAGDRNTPAEDTDFLSLVMDDLEEPAAGPSVAASEPLETEVAAKPDAVEQSAEAADKPRASIDSDSSAGQKVRGEFEPLDELASLAEFESRPGESQAEARCLAPADEAPGTLSTPEPASVDELELLSPLDAAAEDLELEDMLASSSALADEFATHGTSGAEPEFAQEDRQSAEGAEMIIELGPELADLPLELGGEPAGCNTVQESSSEPRFEIADSLLPATEPASIIDQIPAAPTAGADPEAAALAALGLDDFAGTSPGAHEGRADLADLVDQESPEERPPLRIAPTDDPAEDVADQGRQANPQPATLPGFDLDDQEPPGLEDEPLLLVDEEAELSFDDQEEADDQTVSRSPDESPSAEGQSARPVAGESEATPAGEPPLVSLASGEASLELLPLEMNDDSASDLLASADNLPLEADEISDNSNDLELMLADESEPLPLRDSDSVPDFHLGIEAEASPPSASEPAPALDDELVLEEDSSFNLDDQPAAEQVKATTKSAAEQPPTKRGWWPFARSKARKTKVEKSGTPAAAARENGESPDELSFEPASDAVDEPLELELADSESEISFRENNVAQLGEQTGAAEASLQAGPSTPQELTDAELDEFLKDS
jgi:hypothetical protein